jgi:hypothetical protein
MSVAFFYPAYKEHAPCCIVVCGLSGSTTYFSTLSLNPLNAELNPICHLLALLGGAIIVVVSRLRVKRHDFLENVTER